MKRDDWWRAAANWAGHHLDATQIAQLEQYRDWLLGEAVAAGGIGPNESERIDQRHIADSLLFAVGFEDAVSSVADLGSGVGLPGIPLAILLPGCRFSLVDRSGRRCRLLRRVVRILGLENVQVVEGEITGLAPAFPAVVSRAALPPDQARTQYSRLLQPGGVGILGGSWSSSPAHVGWETVTVPAKILDHEVWLLIMRPR